MGAYKIGWKVTTWILGIMLFLFVFGSIIGVVGGALGWFSKAATVVSQEVDPAYLLKKYEWFKDVSASLDRHVANISVYESRVKSMNESYNGEKRKEWTREDRQQVSIWMSEVTGVKAAYNGLAAEYNAQMAKINWAFCNVGQLPKGTDRPLPREYKQYITE